jgi:hypothetical protein
MGSISAHKKELDDLEKTMESIRRDFEQYFQGLSKRPPTSSQAQFAGVMRKMKEEEIKEWNTQDRFRFNQIHARFVSMERMWARTLKQIEDGTYKRDKFKVQRMKQRDATKLSTDGTDRTLDARRRDEPDATVDGRGGDGVDAFDVDLDGFDDEAPARPAAPAPRPAPARAPAAAPAAAAPSAARPAAAASASDLGGLSEARLQQLHKVYVDAKRRTGEQSSLTLEALRAQVAKQVPTIRQKHGCEQVDFKVVLKDGKAMLKAIPK